MSGRSTSELLGLIGETAFIQLVEAFGGCRLFVPAKLDEDHEIVRAVGMAAAKLLSSRYSPDVIRVPLGRDERARRYRAQGWPISQIARALGMTETGVHKLLARLNGGA